MNGEDRGQMASYRNGKKIDLDKLFSPNSIAIVGASETRHYSQSLIANLRGHGFNDENIYPINPKYETVSAPSNLRLHLLQ